MEERRSCRQLVSNTSKVFSGDTMHQSLLSEREWDIVVKSLRAAADGPFFPDWEFETLVGASREEVRVAAFTWVRGDKSSRRIELATSVIGNLLGYPHDQMRELMALVGADRTELEAIIQKLSG